MLCVRACVQASKLTCACWVAGLLQLSSRLAGNLAEFMTQLLQPNGPELQGQVLERSAQHAEPSVPSSTSGTAGRRCTELVEMVGYLDRLLLSVSDTSAPRPVYSIYQLHSRAEWKRGIGHTVIIQGPAGNLTMRIASYGLGSTYSQPNVHEGTHAHSHTRLDCIELFRDCSFPSTTEYSYPPQRGQYQISSRSKSPKMRSTARR